MRHALFASAVVSMLVFGSGCQLFEGSEYARPTPEKPGGSHACMCADMMGGSGKCKCTHCSNEEPALCYCGSGGCKCGAMMDQCKCGHCSGKPGGDDGKGNCTCGG